MKHDTLLSIAEYVALLNENLKRVDAKIIGEVTEVRQWSSGHVYFTLKDPNNGAELNCIIWKGDYRLFGVQLEVGMELVLYGYANIYASSGKLSFITRSLELVGEGVLKKAYEDLKRKLNSEGLFSSQRKRPIPQYPQKVGIVTSKQGAVIQDFINNLGRHGFQVILIDSRVEGMESLPDLFRAIKTMKKQDVEVIVVMRGGGSLQSLAAFNAESFVREIASSTIPVISAIGHDQDVPLCALVADVMVSTPTAAATLLCSGWKSGTQAVLQDSQKIMMSYSQGISDANMTIQIKQVKIIEKFQRILSVLSYTSDHMVEYMKKVAKSIDQSRVDIARHSQHILTHFRDGILAERLELVTLGRDRLVRSYMSELKNTHLDIQNIARLIYANDPMRQIALGFSLVRKSNGILVKSIKDVKIGERLSLTTEDGVIDSRISSITKKKRNE